MVGQTQSPWVKQNPSSCLTQCQTEKKSFCQLWYFPILVHLKSGQIREVALYEGDYSYVPQTKFERHIVFVPFLIIFLSFFRQKFVWPISRRCLDQTLWNLVGISYAMWSCAFKGWFFQNGCHYHGNGQNAKKMKNTKMIIAGYLPNRNWWNLIGTTSTSSGTR
jgi:hypothetical protein